MTGVQTCALPIYEDIEDEGQTVSFPAPEPEPEPESEPAPGNPGKGYPKTGALAHVDPVAASILVIALCGCAGAGYAYIRRSRNTAKAIDALEKEVVESADQS